ncbi:MAG: thioesterase family protein [Oleibacter sp.]|nr:thioesterase family protein [Thalassolituus sp.]
MINYLRYFLLLFNVPWRFDAKKSQQTLYGISVTSLRVMPWDIDLNLHLTNSRYPAFLDIVRTKQFFELGIISLFVRGGWTTVLASQTVTFIREIKPFEKIRIESKLLYWDDKYFYVEHRWLVKNKLHCKAIARVAMIHKGKVQSLGSMLKARDKMNRLTERDYPAPHLKLGLSSVPEVDAKIELLSRLRDSEPSL